MSADEMGPIAIAAYWNGYDFSEVMSHGAYYSYGYSIILFPLLLIFKNQELFYKSAIVVNALFSAVMTFLSWRIAKEIKPDVKPALRLLVALFCGANIINISRSPSAWAEVFLSLLSWLLLFLLVKIVKSGKIGYYLLCSFVSVLLYATHQRTIGIFIIIHVFVFFISLYNNKRRVNLLAYVVSLAILLACHYFIKTDIKKNVWLNSPSSNTNDYKMYLTRYFGDNYLIVLILAIVLLIALLALVLIISSLLKKRDKNSKAIKVYNRVLIISFITLCFAAVLFLSAKHLEITVYSLSAQLLYIGISTLGMAYLGLIIVVYKTLCWIKNGGTIKKESYKPVYAYALLAFLAMFSISIISTSTSADPLTAWRGDYLFYGRYTEPMVGIICFFGAINLDSIYKKRIVCSLATVLIVAFTVLGINRFELFKGLHFSMHNCIALQIFSNEEGINFFIGEVVMVSVLILFIWVGWEWMRYIALLGSVVFALISGITYVKEEVLPMQESKYEYKTLIEEKESLDSDAPFYYFGVENDYIYNSSFVQFLMPGLKSVLYGDMDNVPDSTFYAVTDNYDFLYEHKDLNIIDNVDKLYLFTNAEVPGHDYGIIIPFYKFAFNQEFDAGEYTVWCSDGSAEYFMFGPYETYERGRYKVTLFYNATSKDEGGEKGIFDVCCEIGLNILNSAEITDDENGMISLFFELPEQTPNIEFRVYTTENQSVTVDKVMIKRISE